MSLLVVAACVPPAPSDPYDLTARLGEGEVLLAWTDPPGGGSTFDVQMLVDGVGWTDLPDAAGPSATVTGLAPRTRTMFRVRAAGDGGSTSPGPWSTGVAFVYVEPVLPVLRIDTEDSQPVVDKENYVRATMTLDPNGTAFAPYSGTLGIRGRGNSTWAYPKKPYRLKLDTKSPMMGMAAERDWVLLANYVDRSQLRTWTAGEISRTTELQFTPTFHHVEVVLNGEYVGVYQLTENIEPGAARVDIDELEPGDDAPPEVTGGYLLEIDARLEENDEPGWRTDRWVPVVVKEPDPTTPAQRTYIKGHVDDFEDALFSPDYRDPALGYRRYLDVASFADHYLVQELTQNQDVFFSSTFFTKHRGDDRLRFGPMWDFDRSMGSPSSYVDPSPEGWWARTRGPWSNRLFTDPALVQDVAARWSQFEAGFRTLPERIEDLGTQLAPAVLNDAARWRYDPAPTDDPTYLSNWLQARIDWIDGQLSPPS